MNASWNSPASASRPSGFLRGCLVWTLGIGAGIALLITAGALKSQGTRSKVWPILRQTVERLRSDEGAAQLYARNPALASAYPTQAAFLERVRSLRPGLDALPAQEPEQDEDHYRISAGPSGFRARVQAPGGSWLLLQVEGPGALGLRDIPGEGITRLELAHSLDELREAGRQREAARAAETYGRLRNLAQALQNPDAARGLYRQNPDLAKAWPSEAAFLDQIAAWRPKLPVLPEDKDAATGRFSSSRREMLGRTELRLSYGPDGGAALQAVWVNDRLQEIRLVESPH